MSMTESLQARGWSNQIIASGKVVMAVMVIGGFILGGMSIFSVTVSVPARLGAVEVQQVEAKIAARSIRAEVSAITWYIEFLVRTECAQQDAKTKAIIRNGGGVDCDNPNIKIPR